MRIDVNQLAKDAMGLPPEERVDLAERLWASVEGAEREKVERAWAEEIERRIDEIEGGRAGMVDAGQVLGEIEGKIRARGK